MELTAPQTSAISLDQIQAVLEIYETGRYLEAYRATEAWGPFSQWRGVRAQILAGRLASNLGAMRQGNWLMRCAWHSDPADPEACYYYGFKRWRTRGPYFAWKWIQQREPLPPDTTPEVLASWYALCAGVTGSLRDFDAAEQWMRRAEETAPESPWVHVCWSQLLEWEDRYEEALQATRRSLELRPRFRPGLQAAAHVLSLLDRDEEAIELLNQAAPHLESNAIFVQLYQMQSELKRYDQARDNLERAVELSPLAEKDMQQWFAAQRSEIAYRLGDFEAPCATPGNRTTSSSRPSRIGWKIRSGRTLR
jgi:cellulose synthase operon protein C